MFYSKNGYPLVVSLDDQRLHGPVCVYKKLTVTKTVDGPRKNLWSITTVKPSGRRGLLICYADRLVLTGVRAFVDESARKRIESGAYREVCAWLIGRIHHDTSIVDDDDVNRYARVTFHPRERGEFFRDDTGDPVVEADALWFGAGGNAWLM